LTHPIKADYLRALRDAGPTADTLRWVAFFYRLGIAVGDHPSKSVEQIFNGDVFDKKITRTTIDRRISKARDQGLLGPAEGRGRAGESNA